MEGVLGKVLVQGIEVWWPEEGDRRKGATAERAGELRSSLVDVMREEEDMTGGSYIQINISECCLADRPPLPSGLSARLNVTK